MSDYIAEQYARRMVEASVMGANDYVWDSVSSWAKDDDLELTEQQAEDLMYEVRNIMNTRLVITFK